MVCLFFYQLPLSQSSGKQDIRFGLYKFILGTSKASYDLSIKLVPGGNSTGIQKYSYYQYLPAIKTPLVIEHVQFNSVMLVFNEENRLTIIDFSKWYRKPKSEKPLKRGSLLYRKFIELF